MMRLLKTHSHTSERRGYEAENKREKKKEERRPIRQGQEHHQAKSLPYHLQGRWGEDVSTEQRKPDEAPQPERGGARRNYTMEKRKQEVKQSCRENKKSHSPVERTRSHTVL